MKAHILASERAPRARSSAPVAELLARPASGPLAATAPARAPAPAADGLPNPHPRAWTAPLPRFAQIEPVGQCNLRCRMCPISERPDNQRGSPPAFIDEALFRRLVDGLPELEELHLQGMGEPLMHPRFFHLVRYAVGKGIRVSTNTNLTLLTPLRAHLAVASGLAALNASIDGATADTYQYIRRGANFDKVLRNLERLMASREAMNTGTPEVSIVTVVMRRNLGELARIVGLAWEHGVRRVFVQHLCHDYGEHSLPPEYRSMRDFVIGESLLGENPARVADNFAEARHAAAELGVELRLPPLAPGETRRSPRHPLGCEWPYRGAYLSYSGQAMPCCMVSTPDRANLGDMAREGIAAVWNGPEYRAFRAALASDKPPEVCRGCAIYKGTF